ncbi:MAG TPA: YggT family protein [Actinomycetota bacterium]|jgi:YggT family protein|nr:YggT family protein [Actinomycetota bacterium]
MTLAQSALMDVVCVVLTAYTIILFIRVLVSWAFLFGFRPPYSGPLRTILDLLDDVTEPVLRPLRALIPPIRAGGVGLDLSIIIAFVILAVLRTALNC